MHTTYTQKILPLIRETENAIKATNTSELVDFLDILVQQLEQTQTTALENLPIIFFGTPNPTEQTAIEQYIGQALPTAIPQLNGHSMAVAQNSLPCLLYHWKNIKIPQWQQGAASPGILIIFEDGLDETESIAHLQFLVKKLPLLKLIHANSSNEFLQAISQVTGSVAATPLATLTANTLATDVSKLSNNNAFSHMNAFVALSTFKATTRPLLEDKAKTIKLDIYVRKQTTQQALTQLSKKEKQYLNNQSAAFKQIISKRLKQFEAILAEQLNYQFHPTEGQLSNSLEQSLAQLDDLEGKKEGKNIVYSIAPTFTENISQQFKEFCQTACQDNLQLSTIYLEIIQRELQVFLNTQTLHTHLAMPTFLVEDKMDGLIRDAIKSSNNFSVATPKKKFKDYLMAVREPFFIFMMMGSILGFRDSLGSLSAAYIYPFITFIIGYILFNLWSKGLADKETMIVKGITSAREQVQTDSKRNAKEFSSNWQSLLSNRIKDIAQQWQQQIDRLLQQQTQQAKEQLQAEKNRLQLILTQLTQQENALGAFERHKVKLNMSLNRPEMEIRTALKKVFGGR